MIALNRLSEFYETLAHHFTRAGNVLKAVEYLVKSGEKSLQRYAVDEANLQYKEAFKLIMAEPDTTGLKDEIILGLLNKWALVFYYLGDFAQLDALLSSQEQTVRSMTTALDKKGMFYVWQGVVKHVSGLAQEADAYYQEAKTIGEKINDHSLIAYACAWLTWNCSELGQFDKGVKLGHLGIKYATSVPLDRYLYFKILSGISTNYFSKGNSAKCSDMGRLLVDYGKEHFLIRSLVFGYIFMGCGALLAGDMDSALRSLEGAKNEAVDPYYELIANIYFIIALIQTEQFDKAGVIIDESIAFCKKSGNGQFLGLQMK